MIVDTVENMRRKIDAENRDRAVFYWEVRRMPDVLDERAVDNAEVLVSEYDSHGILHRLAEITTAPPFLFCLISPRATIGIPHRFVRVDPGWFIVWQHRVRERVYIGSPGSPGYIPPTMEDCAIFGREHIDGRQELMLVYPDGAAYGFATMHDALSHSR